MKGWGALLRGLALACAAFVGGAAAAAPAAPSYELNFWALMPGGTASGAGMHEAGKKVTLKATPAKGHVFSGWYEVHYGTAYRLEGDVDFRTPTYSYMMPPSNIVICAEFVPVDEDVAEISPMVGATVVSEVVCTPKAEIEPIVLSVVNCKSLPKVTVKGLPPGLKFTAKKLTTRDGTVLKANTVYGAPTKSGVYEMTATVTTATKKTAKATVTFVVADGSKGERVLRVKCNAERGKVSGVGVYAEGKKVSLKATAAKGYVFAGWYDDVAGGRLEGEVDFRTPAYPYVMPASDAALFAKFVPVGWDDAQLTVRVDGTDVDTCECAPNEAIRPLDLNVHDCISLPKVTVKGLPPGLKFTAKKLLGRDGTVLADANTIYGTPTKSGVYETTITVTTAGKSKLERRFPIAVDNQTAANARLRVTDAASGEPTTLKNARGEKYTVYAGVAEHALPALAAGDAADKLTLSGLPAGLKFTAKELRNRDGTVRAAANTIYGVPTKAGTYTATATVRSGRESFASTFTVEVVALPAWAVGTFVGTGDDYEIEPYEPCEGNLHWTFTVSASGKVSGKAHFDTDEGRLLTATFSRPSFEMYAKDIGKYRCDIDLVFKDKGKVVKEETRRLYVSAEPYEDFASKKEEMDGRLTVGYAQLLSMPDEEFRNYALQNVWKRKGFEALPQFAARKTSVARTSGTSTLTLDIVPKGTVSATLALMDGGKVKTFAAKGDLIVSCYEVLDDGKYKYGNPVYLAGVSLVFKDRLLHAEIEMKVSEDGKVHAEGCEIVSVDRFAAEEAEDEPETGE